MAERLAPGDDRPAGHDRQQGEDTRPTGKATRPAGGRTRFGAFPALDGVRGTALVFESLFHAFVVFSPTHNPLKPSGGYLGLDVFFVLSGFLITTLLLDERRRHGRLDLAAFYQRRALRLFPALAVCLVVVVTVAALRPSFPWSGRTLRALPWIVFYAGNWNGAVYGGGNLIGPLEHTWSLAIEEQFYLLWPLLLIFLCRRCSRRTILAVLGTAVAAIMVYRFVALHQLGWSISRAYYGTDTRADDLLIGAALAVLLEGRTGRPLPARVGRAVNVATVATVAVFAYLAYRASFVTARGLWLDIPVASVCTAVLIASLVTRPPPVIGTVLASRPLSWLGRRSYGIYLWFTALLFLLGSLGSWGLGLYGFNLVVFVIAVTVAALSYRYVETPFLRRKAKLSRR